MKIDEAIEILTDLAEGTVEQIYNERENAIKLGIEALKRIDGQRFHKEMGMFALLPSETKD